MRTHYTSSSYSMPRALQRRLQAALPHYGDCSKLVARLIEMYLDGELPDIGIQLKTRVAQRNTSLGDVDARQRTA